VSVRLCSVAGCSELHLAKNLCRLHYDRLYRKAHPEKLKNYGRTYRERHSERIRAAESSPARRAQKREWARRDPERARRKRRKQRLKLYGLTLSEYDALLAAQGGACATCRRRPDQLRRKENLHVDHCHQTGRVRGLLCYECNAAIGTLGDTAEALRRAVAYLEAAEAMRRHA
jgi:hypothetical protein